MAVTVWTANATGSKSSHEARLRISGPSSVTPASNQNMEAEVPALPIIIVGAERVNVGHYQQKGYHRPLL